MSIRLIDLDLQHRALLAELREAFERVTESAQFIGGPEVAGFEAEFATLCGAEFAVGCGSGTDALVLALLAQGVSPGDEVVVPALSFYASAGAVALLGAIPVFADVDPVFLGLDAESASAEASRCRRLRALLPVHLYGAPSPIGDLETLAAARQCALIEDAAQAIGARHQDGRPVGAGSRHGACFSFYPTKNLGAMGEAGAVCTDDPELAARLRRVRNHGSDGEYRHCELGWNARLDALQAAFLRVKLRHFETWRAARHAHATRYDEALRALGAGPPEAAYADLEIPVRLPISPPPPARHAVHHYVIRVPAARRDALRAFLADRQIETAVYYPRGLHREESFRSLPSADRSFPVAEQAALEVLALPVHPSLRPEDLERVADGIRDFFLR